MNITVKWLKPTKYAISKGWNKIKIEHIVCEISEYKVFYYVSDIGIYREHKYKTTWIRFKKTIHS